jgi:hypothetical protein
VSPRDSINCNAESDDLGAFDDFNEVLKYRLCRRPVPIQGSMFILALHEVNESG